MTPDPTDRPPQTVLFVCLGNICRSALAEGIFRGLAGRSGLADSIKVDSAGTGDWHVGNPPDPRAIAEAARHDVDISGQRARQVSQRDFDRFDLMLAMDRSNLQTLADRAPPGHSAACFLFMEYALDRNEDVPDPYFGGPEGFEQVYRMLEAGSEALLERLAGRR